MCAKHPLLTQLQTGQFTVKQVDLLSTAHFRTVLQWTEMVKLDVFNLDGSMVTPKHNATLLFQNRNAKK